MVAPVLAAKRYQAGGMVNDACLNSRSGPIGVIAETADAGSNSGPRGGLPSRSNTRRSIGPPVWYGTNKRVPATTGLASASQKSDTMASGPSAMTVRARSSRGLASGTRRIRPRGASRVESTNRSRSGPDCTLATRSAMAASRVHVPVGARRYCSIPPPSPCCTEATMWSAVGWASRRISAIFGRSRPSSYRSAVVGWPSEWKNTCW
jgi:hypothetical protein